jgi:hypothetical protein
LVSPSVSVVSISSQRSPDGPRFVVVDLDGDEVVAGLEVVGDLEFAGAVESGADQDHALVEPATEAVVGGQPDSRCAAGWRDRFRTGSGSRFCRLVRR